MSSAPQVQDNPECDGEGGKVYLPDGGRLLPDAELRGLEGGDLISLPFPVLAIEYRDSGARNNPSRHSEGDIFLQHVLYFKGEGWADHRWIVTCGILLSRFAARYAACWQHMRYQCHSAR